MQLGGIPNPLDGLTPSELSTLTLGANHRRVEPGQYFFRQGDHATTWYVMLEGCAKLYESTPDGREVIQAYVHRGDIFGLIERGRFDLHPESALATEASHAFSWPAKELAALVKAHPRFATNVINALTHRLRTMEERYRDAITLRVEQRLAMEILRLAVEAGQAVEGGVRIGVPTSGPDLADLAATTLYSVSRVLARWKTEGFVVSQRRHLILRNIPAIESIARDGALIVSEGEEMDGV